MGESLCSIECSCISKFVQIQNIPSTQVSDTGPLVLWVFSLFVLEFYDPVNNEVMSSRSVNSGIVPGQA